MFYFSFLLAASTTPMQEVRTIDETAPKYLYKVISLEDWNDSQQEKNIKLSSADAAFIHFSRDDQLERITSKYWANVPVYYILKIDTEKLPGRMVFEVNPGGSAKYYHLYNGSIPLDAVVEAKEITKHDGQG